MKELEEFFANTEERAEQLLDKLMEQYEPPPVQPGQLTPSSQSKEAVREELKT